MTKPDPEYRFKVEEPSGRVFYADTARDLIKLGIKTKWVYGVAWILKNRERTWMTICDLLVTWEKRPQKDQKTTEEECPSNVIKNTDKWRENLHNL